MSAATRCCNGCAVRIAPVPILCEAGQTGARIESLTPGADGVFDPAGLLARIHPPCAPKDQSKSMLAAGGLVPTQQSFPDHLHGGLEEPEMKIIDVFIGNLRKKPAKAGPGSAIKTVRDRGNMLRDPAEKPRFSRLPMLMG
jgi:hypothetical protein